MATGIAINVTVLDDTDIEDAYDEIKALSEKFGGVKIATEFNGVKMLYYGQTEGVWEAEYVSGAVD